MGVFDFVKGQFIEVIEYTENFNDRMVYKFPVKGNEIKMGAQLTVRESQVAVFINEGKIADVFEPGSYTLHTENMPILTKLKSWKYGFNSPFKADVYFVNTKQFTNQKWGTSNPIMMRDKDFGVIRLRGFGKYSFKVIDPTLFLKEIFGTSSSFEVNEINKHLKSVIISSLADYIAESKIAALDLAMNYDEIGKAARNKIAKKFALMGLTLVDLVIENFSLPPKVEEMIDKRSSMGVVGDMNTYTQFQSANAIEEAAKNPGNGLAGAGVGMGAGMGMANMMNNSMNQTSQKNTSKNETIACPHCNKPNPKGAKFCSNCGKQVDTSKVNCIKCNALIKKGSKFCPECGAKQELKCPACGKELSPNSKFCPECGEKI